MLDGIIVNALALLAANEVTERAATTSEALWVAVAEDSKRAKNSETTINSSVWKSAFGDEGGWLLGTASDDLEAAAQQTHKGAKGQLEIIASDANIKEGYVKWALENNLADNEEQAKETFEKSSENKIEYPNDHIEILAKYPFDSSISQEDAVALWMADGKGNEILSAIPGVMSPISLLVDPDDLSDEKKEELRNNLSGSLANIDPPDDETDAEIAKQQDEFWERYAEQCALLTNLDKFSDHYKEQRRKKSKFFGGRIIPFVSGEGDEDIINILRGRHQNLNKFTSEAEKNIYPFIGHDLRLQIVRPKRKKGKLVKEAGGGITLETVPISLNTVKYNTKSTPYSSKATEASASIEGSATAPAVEEILAPLGGRIVFESFSYTMDGNNPATARKDVTAELNFSFSDISFLTKELTETSTGEEQKYKISDLITYPKTIENSLGLGASSKNQYHPDYNRIRAVITTKINDDDLDASGQANLKSAVSGLNSSFESSTMVLNLALQDHEISINKTQHLQYDLKISYRGFMETALKSPMMNALADDKILEQRKRFETEQRLAISAATTEGCPIEDLREIKKNYSRMVDNQVIRAQKSMITRLYDYDMVQKIGINEREMISASKDKIFEYKKIFQGTLTAASGSEGRRETIARKKAEVEAANKAYTSQMHFFYLGDLLYVMSDVLYKPEVDTEGKRRTEDVKNYDKLKAEVSHLNYRIGVGSFLWKDPNLGKDAKPVSINIADIPLSLNFFKKWYDEVVIKKERKFYSVSVMAMDLVERLITNILNDICVNFENDENVRFRLAHFESTGDPLLGFLIDSEGEKPVINLAESSEGEYPIFKTDSTTLASDYTNYSIIYASTHNVYSEKHQSGKRTEISKNGIPIFNVKPLMDKGCIKTASFKRTNVPGLRESRYFNGGVGGVSLLSNHYSITMDLWPNTYFVPGMLIFVYVDEDSLGDPMDTTSMANELGIGGYHLITKVSITIKGNGDFSNQVDAIWTRTTLSGVAKQTKNIPTVEKERKKCKEAVKKSDILADAAEMATASEKISPR